MGLPPLTPKQEAFARAYVETSSASRAYRMAYNVGPNTLPTTIAPDAWRVRNLPQVEARINALQAAVAAAFVFDKGQLASFLWKRLMADRAQIVQQVKRCCRHCYGTDHHYQWKDAVEYATAYTKWSEDGARGGPPDYAGGFGFDPHLPPAATCTAEPCLGDGTTTTVIADTLSLEGGAALIYEGVDRFGLPVLADRASDLAAFCKITGLGQGELEGMLRGAAAGGAMGAVSAQAVVEKVKTMNSDDTRRAYLTMIGGA